MATKTASNYSNVLTVEMLFQYIENTSQFNLQSSSPYKYMTLFHMGTDSSKDGWEVCLVKKDAINIQIGVRYSNASVWTELAGSFRTLPNITTNGMYFMFQYNKSSTIANFYVVDLDNTTKTAADFVFTTTTSPSVSVGGQWGFGSSPENIVSSGTYSTNEGYLTINGYNSYIAENIVLNYLRTWKTVVPYTSSTSSTYAMFNSNNGAHSLYTFMKSNTYVPALTPNLDFQLFIPSDSTDLAGQKNNASNPATNVTLTSSTSSYPTLNPTSQWNFASNNTTSLNLIAASAINCICKNTDILTPNGVVLIENLKVGDYILTHDNRKVSITDIKICTSISNANLIPRIIRKGNYNATHDLYLSQYHAVLVDNKFIETGYLDHDLSDKSYQIIEYYCIKLENFLTDTLVANGVVVEAWG
jgi:hypothetical protein